MSAQSQLILNGLSAGVLLLDRNGRAVFLNPAAEQILGCSQQHGLGRKSADLFRHCPGLAKLVERALDGQQLHTLSGVSVESGPGQPGARLIDCNAVPVDIERGGGMLIELVDVTRREKISRENALLEQHGVSRTMIRQLAHEIRNPLGGLRGAAQLLERRLGDKATKEYTSVIISEADRLAALVDTLLGRSAAEQEEMALSLRRRVNEATDALGVDLPIYVMVTKLDHIEGFVECIGATPVVRLGGALGWTNDQRVIA
ncbi:MAG: PAS domain-containing protein, partial [Proteobacteria bacterium]|nr:PAS domain-containing protein [Pseudomonadota bacterium]